MSRTLYRIYLYLMCVVMLGFAATSLGTLLNTVFLETPLRGIYESPPDSRSVVQSSVLALTALVVTLGIGGLHYWLIRRDLATDPSAGGEGVRALALNLVQAVAALVAFFAGLALLPNIGQTYYGGSAFELAMLLTAALVFALAQWERARTPTATQPARVFEGLHLYGVQTIVLIAAIGAITNAVETSIHVVLVNAHAVPNPCAGFPPQPPGAPGCEFATGLFGIWLALLWTAGAWLFYGWLARAERRSIFRQLAHFLGFLVGLGSVVYGVERAAEWLLRAGFHVSGGLAIEYVQGHEFVAAVVFGALVLLLYARRLTLDSGATRLGAQGTQLTMLTLAALGLGIPFYLGIVQLGHGLMEAVFNGDRLAGDGWAVALALLIAGLGHPLLAYLLREQSAGEAPIGPRRAYVFGGLAAGGLTAAISLAIALYLFITALIGSPVGADWAVSARYAVVALLAGGFIAGVHLWRLLQQRAVLFPVHPVPTPASGVSPVASGSIEAVLDDLLAGRITREQAVERLRALLAAPAMLVGR